MAVNWTQVLVYGVPSCIGALGGAIAAILGVLNHRNTKTSNGKSLAQAVEQTHELATANADALDKITPPPSG